jgi:hypothetical protein
MPDARIWTSQPAGRPVDTVAIFNLSEKPLDVDEAWSTLGLPSGVFTARNLWNGARSPARSRARLTVAPHDVALLRIAH